VLPTTPKDDVGVGERMRSRCWVGLVLFSGEILE
jgi:hypothetical protein